MNCIILEFVDDRNLHSLKMVVSCDEQNLRLLSLKHSISVKPDPQLYEIRNFVRGGGGLIRIYPKTRDIA